MKAIESMGYVTPRDYSAFVKFNVFKGKFYRLKTAVTTIFLLILSAFFILMGIAQQYKGYFIIAGVILLGMFMFVYTINVNVKNHCSRNAKVVRAKQNVKFGKNGFIFDLLFQNEQENEHDEIFYDELQAVYDAKTAIYLYIEKRSVVIVPKRNLNMSPAEAREFLLKYIPSQILVICA